MNAVTHPFERISVDDYLLGEQQTDIKHEYLDGQVVASLTFFSAIRY